MIAAPLPTAPAYLWVLAEPGELVTVAGFNDWYDNEHVPLRMGHISEFLTGARYIATDSLKPCYAASYDIESVALFSHEKYTKLRANRSIREGALVKNLEVLDRRTCVKIDETTPYGKASQVAQFVITIAGNEEIKGNGKKIQGVEGWRRSHRHRIFDSLLIGVGKESQMNVAPKFVIIHEFDTEDFLKTSEWQEALKQGTEVRRWKLLKATDNTAATLV